MSVIFQFDLITPEKLVYSHQEQMVTVPGAEGYFGVLPGHAPLISMLAMGVLTVGFGNDATRYAIAGGYAEVLPDHTTILADRVICWDAIDPEAVAAEKQEAVEQGLAVVDDKAHSHYWQERQAFADVCLSVHKQYLARSSS
ncbi:MAG: ATP synthase F1 subunit epsilon [Magnetococcales bacterium]|nr:ATP synthase F1 subunit epsilon [Magnetococcales bacterium]